MLERRRADLQISKAKIERMDENTRIGIIRNVRFHFDCRVHLQSSVYNQKKQSDVIFFII